MNPGKLQKSKQRSQDLCLKVYDPAQSFVLCSDTMPVKELHNRNVVIGFAHTKVRSFLYFVHDEGQNK